MDGPETARRAPSSPFAVVTIAAVVAFAVVAFAVVRLRPPG
ncbi:hypothetical protein ACFWDQ_09630 [Streptomyces sp. NPDC060053]